MFFKETTDFLLTRVKTKIRRSINGGKQKTLLFAAVGLHAFRDETGKRALSAEGRSNPDRARPVPATSSDSVSTGFLVCSCCFLIL